MQRRTFLAGTAFLFGGVAHPAVGRTEPVTRETTSDGLAATWLQPREVERFPAVLIIAGSGPTDRNGNGNPQILKTDAYRLLAEALAAQGIASLRFDKRGVAASRTLVANAAAASVLTISHFVRDAERLAVWIRAQPGVTSVTAIGHSEGGLIASLFDAAVPLDGIVQLAAPGRPLADILTEQLRRAPLPEDTQAEAERIIGAFRTGGEIGTVQPPLDQLFAPPVHTFMRSVFNLDPAARLAARSEPLLVLGGGRDIQVRREDFDALAKARSAGVRTIWIDEMTHVLKAYRSNDPAQTALYREPQHPLMPGLADTIATWVKAL